MKKHSSPRIIVRAVIAAFLATAACAQEKADPITLDTLTTTKGKVYKNVKVREVTPSGIKIFHEAGSASLPHEELPADLKKMVGGFDPEKAKKHRAEENKALREQEQHLDRELKKLPQDAPAPDTAKPSGNGPAVPQAKKDKGELTARIVGYRTGVKRVEFKALTNCNARLVVHNVAPDGHSETFEVTDKVPLTREVWVFNNYSSELFDSKNGLLDKEASRQKTETGTLTKPTLR